MTRTLVDACGGSPGPRHDALQNDSLVDLYIFDKKILIRDAVVVLGICYRALNELRQRISSAFSDKGKIAKSDVYVLTSDRICHKADFAWRLAVVLEVGFHGSILFLRSGCGGRSSFGGLGGVDFGLFLGCFLLLLHLSSMAKEFLGRRKLTEAVSYHFLGD